MATRLSDGQRVMLRAGLAKLRKLEADLPASTRSATPRCWWCARTPRCRRWSRSSCRMKGLPPDEVMTIDSGKKAELGEKDWAPVRERLFSVDRHATPRVIVSVLMLREGFDVNNICVIVPLRSSQAQILLEQTIGRGLRLMWRDADYTDLKRENRERINAGQEPASLIDVLSIVEHPAFQSFYDELMKEGLAGTTSEDSDTPAPAMCIGRSCARASRRSTSPFRSSCARRMSAGASGAGLCGLPPFTTMSRSELAAMLGKGDVPSSRRTCKAPRCLATIASMAR
jgi:type III restriction enzyme